MNDTKQTITRLEAEHAALTKEIGELTERRAAALEKRRAKHEELKAARELEHGSR